jgi:hypothetical protein
MDNNPVHEAMLFYWGERCSAYHEECVCCKAWEQYDGKHAAQPAQDATMQSLKDLKRSVCDEVGKAAFAQPAQEPPPWWPAVENILEEYGLQAIDFVADFNAALAGRERNFCERCGKRTADLTTIHTCTPPQEQPNG